MNAKPHVSAAVKQLRLWVTLCSLMLAACCLAQALVFAFVHYTDVRWTTLTEKVTAPPRVVGSTGPLAGPGAPVALGPGETGGIRSAALDKAKGVEVNRVHSAAEGFLRNMSEVASGAGGMAAICLLLLTMLGVCVAGGGSILGVEKTVTAAVWSIVLGVLCLPMNRLFPTMPMPGIFTGYDAMTLASETWSASGRGGLGTLAQWVFLPLASAFTAAFVCLWFRAGVRRGILITSMSELELAAEKEMAAIQKRGVLSRAPKSVGALNRALGDMDDAGTRGSVEHAVEAASGIAASLARQTGGMGGGGSNGRSVVDDDFRRPI